MKVSTGSFTLKSRQNGAVLLALMLLLLTGSSYLLLINFNTNNVKVSTAIKTSKDLKSAKQLLLSYAVSYPDLGNDGGPGYLPCPDITNDGFAGGNCSYAGGTTIGYFPFKTLDTKELRDGNGNRLWYVLSERYRYGANKTVPMNSDIADNSIKNLDLSIYNNSSEINDVVAIIIAPGIPINGQTRSGNPSDAENLNPGNFMEGDNADNDKVFTNERSDSVNDRLVLITRDELMAVVEKRVLGDLATALQRYRAAYNAFPWLSPFEDPSISAFHSEPMTGYSGHIPFHWSGDTPGSTNRNPFISDIHISWENIQNAEITNNADDSGSIKLPMPTIGCLTNTECHESDDPFNGQVPYYNNVTDANCIWSSREKFDCTGDFSVINNNRFIYTSPISIYGYKYNIGRGWVNFYTDTSGGFQWEIAYIDQFGTGWDNWLVTPVIQGDIDRHYTFDIAYADPNFTTTNDIIEPDATNSRRRNLDINASMLDANEVTITVTDTMTDITFYPDFDNEPTSKQSSRSLTSDNDSIGTIAATGIKYDLDIDEGELPEWFIRNRWHELIYVAYAEGEPYPGSITTQDPCNDNTVNLICLDIDYVSQSGTDRRNNIRTLAVMASRELSGQDRASWPSYPATLSDYFEEYSANSNADADTNYVMKMPDDNFNDSLKVILED